MLSRCLVSTVLLAGLAGWTISSGEGRAQEVADPHQIYETQCAGCHAPHARELVTETLDMADGVLISRRSGQPVASVLRQGHGGLSETQIDVMVWLLRDIRLSDQTFYRKCATCHVTMRELARTYLRLDAKDQVVGRYTGTDIAAFLPGHGRLAPDEVPEMLAKMRSHLGISD